MAAELKEKFGVDIELIASSGGVFEVIVDGKKVYSKVSTGRFPGGGEVADAIDAL